MKFFQRINHLLFSPMTSDVFLTIIALCKIVLYTPIPLCLDFSGFIRDFVNNKLFCVIYPQKLDTLVQLINFKRFINLIYIKSQFIHKRGFQLKVRAFITIMSLIFYIETPIYGYNTATLLKYGNQISITWQRTLKSLSFYQEFSIVYLVQAYFVPFSLMLTSTVLIIRGLYKTRKRIETHDNLEMKSRKAKDIKFAVSSIVLDFLFIVLKTPQILTYITVISDRATLALYGYSTTLIFSVNFSKSFFAYLLSNSIFRKELMKIIKSVKSGNISFTKSTKIKKTNSKH